MPVRRMIEGEVIGYFGGKRVYPKIVSADDFLEKSDVNRDIESAILLDLIKRGEVWVYEKTEKISPVKLDQDTERGLDYRLSLIK